eukprot:3115283-Pleurochrysis_carterae.AAC.5
MAWICGYLMYIRSTTARDVSCIPDEMGNLSIHTLISMVVEQVFRSKTVLRTHAWPHIMNNTE